MVDVSIPTEKGSLPRVGHIHPERPWPRQKLVQVIQMFLRLLSTFLLAPLTSMLKTTGSSDLAPRELRPDEVVEGGGRADKMVVDSSKWSKSRQKVKESSKVEKSQRPKKLQRSSVRRNVYRSTDPPSI